MRKSLPALASALLALALAACGESDLGTAATGDNDYTVSLRVEDRFVHVGDRVPLRLSLERTDGSNLDEDLREPVLVTATAHGNINLPELSVRVDGPTTDRFTSQLVFSAARPGIAEVRAVFRDAEALVELVVSSVDPTDDLPRR